jgi:hypothetical protein
MFSKEEEKNLRVEFWNKFGAFSQEKGRRRKWMMQDTGIKAVNLKFDIDRDGASVGIDIVSRDLERRIYYYEKFESLKAMIAEALGEDVIWDLEFPVAPGKEIARIYTVLNEVDIYRKETWEKTWNFFFEKMSALEDLYIEFKDFIRQSADYGTN